MKLKNTVEVRFASKNSLGWFEDDDGTLYCVEIDAYHYEDYGIGTYEFWGSQGHSSTPTCIVDEISLVSFELSDGSRDYSKWNEQNREIKRAWDLGKIIAYCSDNGEDLC